MPNFIKIETLYLKNKTKQWSNFIVDEWIEKYGEEIRNFYEFMLVNNFIKEEGSNESRE